MALNTTIIHCNTWKTFVSHIPETGFAFRGQSEDHPHLTTSLERCLTAIAPKQRWKYEAALLREFKRRAYHYESDLPLLHEHLEWLALMRHHGAPTRLLDFSYSGYVAAFFALSAARSARMPCAATVWQVDLSWLKSALQAHHPRSLLDFHDPKEFASHFLQPAPRKPGPLKTCVAAVNPYRMNERLTIQQALFLCPSDLTVSFEGNLEAMRKAAPITKYLLATGCHREALSALRTMNISFATLYPGLEGFSRSLWHRVDDLFEKYSINDVVLLKEILPEKAVGARKKGRRALAANLARG